jgi:hypothetical protein
MLKWTTAIEPYSKFPDGTVLMHDAHLRGSYREFLRFELTMIVKLGPLLGVMIIPLIWLAGGFFSCRWLASGIRSLPIFVCILFCFCFVQPHIERRRILQGRKIYKIQITKRCIGIDGSGYLFDRMEAVTIQPPQTAGSAGAILFAFGMERVCVNIPLGISPEKVRQNLPTALFRDTLNPAENARVAVDPFVRSFPGLIHPTDSLLDFGDNGPQINQRGGLDERLQFTE